MLNYIDDIYVRYRENKSVCLLLYSFTTKMISFFCLQTDFSKFYSYEN